MSPAKRHHFVPRAYLERFGRDGRVAVRRRGERKLIVAGAHNVAVEAGLYETEMPDGSRSVEVEDWLADIDGAAIAAIRAVADAEAAPAVGSTDRRVLARFLAIQTKRSPEARERVLFADKVITYAAGREIDSALVADYLEKVRLGFRPADGEIEGALTLTRYVLDRDEPLTSTEAIAIVMSGLDEVTRALEGKHWSVEVARKPRLLTSDTPLVLWRRPSAADRYRGIGVDNAEEIRFPLDPAHQLVLTDQPRPETLRVEPDRVRQCNADLAASCHRFVVGHPDHQQRLHEITLADKRSTVRFNVGPPATGWDPTENRSISGTSCICGCHAANPSPPPDDRRAVAAGPPPRR